MLRLLRAVLGTLNETANAVACGNGHYTSVETRDRRG